MKKKIQLLDCTLRDGAYIVDSHFGEASIRGIISRMREANVDIIELGWLKDSAYIEGTTFYHEPSDVMPYLPVGEKHCTYAVMIDWDRYDAVSMPEYDGRSIEAVRVVFPRGKFREGIAVGRIIKEKGYQVYFQAADTLGYTEQELMELAYEVSSVHPVSLSIVDTFGAMYEEDLKRIAAVLDRYMDSDIKLGFHSHNNQQLSFSLSMQFVKLFQESEREIIVDASLCGMGRGAGNAPTELVSSFLNRRCMGNYDLDIILDAIDTYMGYFKEHYEWGYSTPYLIAGMYCAHVNNIAYLQDSHRTDAKDMRNIIESLPEADRKKYDYDLLEEKYLEYRDQYVYDEDSLKILSMKLAGRPLLLLMPGRSILNQKDQIHDFIKKIHPAVIGVNAVCEEYDYDYLFFSSCVRYSYAKEAYPQKYSLCPKIIPSNITTKPQEDEILVNYHQLIKRGWEHFDNAGIMCLRLLNRLKVKEVALAGFDGFADAHSESYADESLPRINPGKKWEALNEEIRDIFLDFRQAAQGEMHISFLTKSRYDTM